MKKLILSLSLIIASLSAQSVFAQDPAQLKEISMQACDAQTAQIPEAQQEMVLRMCKCTVEHTDYETLFAKSAAGDPSVNDDAMAVAQKCSEMNR